MAYTPLQLAEVFIQAGELNDAVDALTQHLDSNPDDDSARRLRAQVYLRLRSEAHYRAALADLDLLIAPTPDDDVTRAIALEYLQFLAKTLDDLDGAMQAIERAREARPGDERIAERYFYMLMARARWDEARSLLDTMPRTWDWLQKAGDLASESEGETQAIQYYTQAIEHLETQFDTSADRFAQSIKSHILANRAQMYATLGQFTEADMDYLAAETLTPDDPTLVFWHSFVVAELGDELRALTLCRTALEHAGESWRVQMIETLKVMRDGGRYSELVDAILAE
jgi:tetratricopeptide (TPR) repeat protein